MMKWVNLLMHDMRCGLLRRRYLITVIIFLLPCLTSHSFFETIGEKGTYADYLLYCFKGSVPLVALAEEMEFRLPVFWILAIGGCLLINLDYLLNDLTNSGHQIIIRCQNRDDWFISKCFWNISSCVLYFGLALLTILVYTLLQDGELTFTNTPEITVMLFYEALTDPVQLSVKDTIVCAIVSPLLTIIAYSLVEMLISLLIKPTIAFLTCIILLITSVYWDLPYLIGNGAMVIRSRYLIDDGIDPTISIAVTLTVIIVSILLGVYYFNRTDIIGVEA